MLRPNTLHGKAANPVAVLVLAQVTSPATKVDAGAVTGQLTVQHAERAYHKLYYNKVDKGGLFAAGEQPRLFSEGVRVAFRSLR